MRIGISYDQGTPKYRLYADALIAAGERYGYDLDLVWLAGSGRRLDLEGDVLERLDGLVLTGGADVDPRRYGFSDPSGLCIHVLPERDAVEAAIVERMLELQIPTLAICRGMQFLNVMCGGSLIPDMPGHEPENVHERQAITLDAESHFAHEVAHVTEGLACCSHHQAVDRLGEGLRAVAWAGDGYVEAIEWSESAGKPWLIAVQWHPERMELSEPLSGRLYQAFFKAAAQKKKGNPANA
jgi:putative glutamine amidotransferase